MKRPLRVIGGLKVAAVAILLYLISDYANAACQDCAARQDGIEVFTGRSTRIIDNERGNAWGASRVLDYGFWPKLNFGYINEGTMHASDQLHLTAKRDGIFALARLERPYAGGLSTYAEIGPYLTGTTLTDKDTGQSRITYQPTLLGGFGAQYKVGAVSASVRWLHVIGTRQVGSADVFVVGIAVWQ